MLFVVTFLARMDRYNHDMGGEDTDDTDDFPLIGSFGSYSPQYRKNNSSLVQINLPPQSLDDSVNTSSGSGTASPISSNLSQSGGVNVNTTQTTTVNSNIGKIMSTPQLRKLDVSDRGGNPFFTLLFCIDSIMNCHCFGFVYIGLPYNCHEIAIDARHRLHTIHAII